jgi:hypothetical protein
MTDIASHGGKANRNRPENVPVAHEGQVVIVAVIISVLLHIALAYLTMNLPLGHVDPQLLSEFTQVYPVQRATKDAVEQTGLRATLGDRAWSEERRLVEQAVAVLGQNANNPSNIAMTSPIRLSQPGESGPASDLGIATATNLPEMLTRQIALPVGMEEAGGEGEGSGMNYVGPGGGTGTGMSSRAQALLGDRLPGLDSGRTGRTFEPDRPASLKPGLDLPAALASGTTMPGDIDITEFIEVPTLQLEAPEHLDEDFDYKVTFLPPTREAGFVRIDVTPKRTLRRLHTMPKDVVFLVDTSISIPQDWVRQVTRGVADALGTLNEGDRFNIVLFSNQPSFFSSEGPVVVTEKSIKEADEFLRGSRAGGMTDVNRALSRLLVRDIAMERVYNLVLITDGNPTVGVVDTRELINIITRDNDLVSSIYCVGIGNNPNRELLEFLSYRNRGFTVLAQNENRVALTIRDLMSRIRFPIMKEIELTTIGLSRDQVFPRALPDVHQGQTFSIYGRYREAGPFTMRLAGHNGRQVLDFTFTRDLKTDATRASDDIRKGWAFWKLHHLYSEMIYRKESPELRKQIEELRDDYGLKVVY